jgi:hypothetical protein
MERECIEFVTCYLASAPILFEVLLLSQVSAGVVCSLLRRIQNCRL